ncbi:MAG: zinc-ribbon domain containing protein [Candidatus Levybacteria bacterium]|nr:zinc-ribbon domain containing protein [Candidatus Levybacteria bacterium]
MANIKQICVKCSKAFLIIDKEQDFLRQKNLSLPTNCPACRQLRRLSLRGGRQLFKANCQKCSKEIVTSYNPTKVKQKIFCKEDYEKYFEENDPIIKDPLPNI